MFKIWLSVLDMVSYFIIMRTVVERVLRLHNGITSNEGIIQFVGDMVSYEVFGDKCLSDSC